MTFTQHLFLWFAGLSLVEIAVWLPVPQIIRKLTACLVIVTLPVINGLLLGLHFQLWAGLLFILAAYRVINLLRVVEGRQQEKYLFRVAPRTSWALIGGQLAVLAAAGLSRQHELSATGWLYLLAAGQFMAALILLSSTLRHLRTTQQQGPLKPMPDKDLPALSVLIPARNETSDLEACLQSLISSDYPKLEILVLDDCSQNKHTPEIIRTFAQSGIRFIAGETPPKRWLAKNFAYKRLSDEANGAVLLFCGVDTRFQPGSLRAIIETMLTKDKQMTSVIPKNQSPPLSWRISESLVQPARYAWEMALPRRLFNRPPVLSTCWAITASALKTAGGLEAASNSISIESYFARHTAHSSDGYSFIQASSEIGLVSAKSPGEQRATAIRTRYPQLHRRPELVALTGIAELSTLILPLALFVASFLKHEWFLATFSGLTYVLLILFYSKIVTLTYRKFLWRGLWSLPFAALYDVFLLNYSMWQYEFREVIWKGRNVCIPVMQPAPKSPVD